MHLTSVLFEVMHEKTRQYNQLVITRAVNAIIKLKNNRLQGYIISCTQ